MKHFIFSLILLSVFSSVIRSQTDSTTYILPEFILHQKVNNTEDAYRFKWDYNKLILYNDTLFANPSKYKYKVSLEKINKISFKDGTYATPGFIYAAAGGLILGFIVGFTLPKETIADGNSNGSLIKGGFEAAMVFGIVFAVISGGIGSLVGLMTPRYEDYELHKTDIDKKRTKLKKVFEKWKVLKQ